MYLKAAVHKWHKAHEERLYLQKVYKSTCVFRRFQAPQIESEHGCEQ